ncbi:MAG TPA: hypothetical protein HA306_01595 [Methanosarcina sp.]|nr:hypothetical protein [Methanosarcina sp.]
MFNLSSKCIRCGTPLKKQIMGSNSFYYCRKCGCTSSIISFSSSTQSAITGTSNI